MNADPELDFFWKIFYGYVIFCIIVAILSPRTDDYYDLQFVNQMIRRRRREARRRG